MAQDLPADLCLPLVRLLAAPLQLVESLQTFPLQDPGTRGSVVPVRRYLQLGPIMRALQMISDYWAHQGHGKLRSQAQGTDARDAFLEEAGSLPPRLVLGPALTLLYLHGAADAKRRASGLPTGGTALMTPADMDALVAHCQEAFTSIGARWQWSPAFAARNDKAITQLRDLSGCLHLRMAILRLADCQDRIKLHATIICAGGLACKAWHNIWHPVSSAARTFLAASAALLHRLALPGEYTTWRQLQQDFVRAMQLNFGQVSMADLRELSEFGDPRGLVDMLDLVWEGGLAQI